MTASSEGSSSNQGVTSEVDAGSYSMQMSMVVRVWTGTGVDDWQQMHSESDFFSTLINQKNFQDGERC